MGLYEAAAQFGFILFFFSFFRLTDSSNMDADHKHNAQEAFDFERKKEIKSWVKVKFELGLNYLLARE